MSIGETTMRLRTHQIAQRNGVNIGGIAVAVAEPFPLSTEAALVRTIPRRGRRTSYRAGADSRDRFAGFVSRGCRRTARAAASRTVRRSRTTPSSYAPRSAVLAPRRDATPRTCLARRRACSVVSSASTKPIASSIASFVPDPTEKCAVCAASPMRTTLSIDPPLVADAQKVQPIAAAQMGAVRHQPVAVKIPPEEPLAKRDRFAGIRRIESVRAPRLLATFDDERAQARVEAIGVHGKPAMLGGLEDEGKRVERQRRPEPYEAAEPPVEFRHKRLAIRIANDAVDPVGADEEIASSRDRPRRP